VQALHKQLRLQKIGRGLREYLRFVGLDAGRLVEHIGQQLPLPLQHTAVYFGPSSVLFALEQGDLEGAARLFVYQQQQARETRHPFL
jgi:hypothetical protein